MTRLKMPPTPASSTEIKGQDHSHQLSTLQMSFELPPSAITQNAKSQASAASKTSPVSPSTKTTYPVQPSETVKSRRRSSAAQKETFALPPPPTRSRRIIQMKPRPQEESVEQAASDKATTANTGKNASGAGSKKKQPSATSAAGRKIARKTAHSLIERRRRSKMNEEFAVLKGLIPACTGEMHKLAILQASIEYVRYLEDCISQLKEQREDQSTTPAPPQFKLPPSNDDTYDMDEDKEDDEEEEGQEDVEMTNSEAPSPVYTQTPARSNQSSISPALVAQDARGRQQSYSSVSTEYRHYSYSGPSATSPAFGPQGYPQHVGPASAITSPALRPQQEIDQEASAALLMLNVDRRAGSGSGSGSGSGRGMSVRDLLSS
ncbi:uncharacterized protein GGS22DRAFT_41346 [Annulohypoxylon maeteangense]|uniref:uncharacterized protein n=1 Tax=Annulohypoxylon maeteangense TaxID=1927788 RepID=UPI0020088F57|nr:uncharacterized protein GGS22DRAFT_41346 [Annulohypoxylon maeteangense]KAI0882811.1 hypothetical protein GGS22DRAFT_41346 [Annulohypoxylon maeteangense]